MCERVFPPQIDGVIIGFLSGSADDGLKLFHDNFELSEFESLYKVQPQEDHEEPAAASRGHQESTQQRVKQLNSHTPERHFIT